MLFGGQANGHQKKVLPILHAITEQKFKKATALEKVYDPLTNQPTRVKRTFGRTFTGVAAATTILAKGLNYEAGLARFLKRHEPRTSTSGSKKGRWSQASQKLMVYLVEKFWWNYYNQLESGTKTFQSIISALPAAQRQWLVDLATKGVLEPGVYPPGWTQLDKTATLP